jgi:hypothetical protein
VDLDLDQMPIKLVEWELVRLKSEEDMWLRAEVNNKKYELKFQAI